MMTSVYTKSNGERPYPPRNFVDGDYDTLTQLQDAGYVVIALQQPAIVLQVDIIARPFYNENSDDPLQIVDVALIAENGDSVQCRGRGGSYFYMFKIPAPRGSSHEGDRWRFQLDCVHENKLETKIRKIKISSKFRNLNMAEIEIFGLLGSAGSGFVTGEAYAPTEGPDPTIEPYENQDIIENVPPELEKNEEGIDVWEGKIEEPVPVKVLNDIANSPDPVKTPLGYLALAGYVDYSLATKKTNSGAKKSVEMTQEDLDDAAKHFLRFNGYPEDSSVTDEMVQYMHSDRCGNPDMVISGQAEDCISLEGEAAIKKESNLYRGREILDNTKSFILAGMDDVSYYFELDVKFMEVRNGRSKAIFLGYNFDENDSNGKGKPLEAVAVRFLKDTLCAQFVVFAERTMMQSFLSKDDILDSCYTPTMNEMKTLTFKIRVDVLAPVKGLPGKAYITVRGHDVAKTVTMMPTISSAVIMYRDPSGESGQLIQLARLCKKKTALPGISNPRVKRALRKKRFSLSYHKWETDENQIRFNFQNYSSELGQDGTRQGVIRALELYTKNTGMTFKEVSPSQPAEIVLMFIKGQHEDGKAFNGAGTVKGHAFSPVHSEVHFNDYEQFALGTGDRKVSIFYVAAHEIGHALGLQHSEKVHALMHAGYPGDSAFALGGLHDDDVNAMVVLYGGSSNGAVNQLSRPGRLGSYTPKFPFPTECHSYIDAALATDQGDYFLISGPFAWKLREAGTGYSVQHGYPKRVSDVFQQANGYINAMFRIGDYIFVIHDGDKISQYFYYDSTLYVGAAGQSLAAVISKDGVSVDQVIRSAFSHNGKIILVSDDLESFYEVTWGEAADTTPIVAQVTLSTDMKSILGRDLRTIDLNAAMTFTRTFAKPGKAPKVMLQNFNTKYVYVENPFAGTAPNVFKSVAEMYNLAGWCPQ